MRLEKQLKSIEGDLEYAKAEQMLLEELIATFDRIAGGDPTTIGLGAERFPDVDADMAASARGEVEETAGPGPYQPYQENVRTPFPGLIGRGKLSR